MDPTALGKLVSELLLAIHLLSGYAIPETPPRVEFLPHDELAERACGRPCQVFGWFPPGQTVYLDDRLDPLASLAARGILLHELVHFLQQEEGTFAVAPDCEAWLEREREAFDIQLRWLVEQRAPLRTIAPIRQMPIRLACAEDEAEPTTAPGP